MRIKHLAFASLALLSVAGAAHAGGPLTDFENGSQLIVTVADVEVDGTAQTLSGARVIEKRAGSVDFELPASDLGFDLPITLHLRGTTSRDGRVEFEIDEIFAEPIEIDGGYRLNRVTGHLSMRAFPLDGTSVPEVGNMYLAIDGKSYIVIAGDWGELSLSVTKLVLQGGILQPPLDRFVDNSLAPICSNRVATQRTFEVSLAGEASGDGALVQFRNEIGSGVLFPPNVVVAAGRSSVAVNARIEPNFVGRVRLSAAAGGVERTIDVDVLSARDCTRR